MNVARVAHAQPRKMLANLDRWLEMATAHAEGLGYDVDTLMQARLAPDMFPLVRQVQSACDAAKFLTARLSGNEAPSHPDTETTMAEARQRIASVLSYLDSFGASAFDGSEERIIELSFLPEPVPAMSYAGSFGLPNFYFHVTTAYAILRHNGVPLGKRDYIGSLG